MGNKDSTSKITVYLSTFQTTEIISKNNCQKIIKGRKHFVFTSQDAVSAGPGDILTPQQIEHLQRIKPITQIKMSI